jgi:cytochrome c oxidase subunit II
MPVRTLTEGVDAYVLRKRHSLCEWDKTAAPGKISRHTQLAPTLLSKLLSGSGVKAVSGLGDRLESNMRGLYGAVILAAAMTAGAVLAQDVGSEPRKIEITAKKFEFGPNEISVKAGEAIQLILTSADAKHGFECKELGIKKVTFEKNKPTTITFTASQPGTYEFKCANFCGFGHGKMKGHIVVTQ